MINLRKKEAIPIYKNMENSPISILLYPYPHQFEAIFISLLFLLIFSSAAYAIYKLISWKMNVRVKTVFNGFLMIVGISILVLFIAELTVSIITVYHVNKQLGFCYATPDSPEGELFEISEVVPRKTIDKAGLKPGDQIQMRNVNDLYRLLINNQGKKVVIDIRRNKKKMNIKILVPKMDVPLEDVSFLY
jgi:hypothetical protein